MDYLCHAWVDEVFIDLQPNDPRVDRWIDQLTEMGVTVHLKLANRMELAANKQFVEKLGRYTVLTTSIRTVSTWELFLKRLMDILGGIVGCILTGILFLILAPMIYHESPGRSSSDRPGLERTARSLRAINSAVCIWMRRNAKRHLLQKTVYRTE